MPSWLSPLVAWGAAAALALVALMVSFFQPKAFDLVWRRGAGAIVAAATRQSREEQGAAAAATARDGRMRSAMATIRQGLTTFAAHGPVPKTEFMVASMTADIHRGVAELRSEEPRVEAELKAITAKVTANRFGFPPEEAQELLAALEAKLRALAP